MILLFTTSCSYHLPHPTTQHKGWPRWSIAYGKVSQWFWDFTLKHLWLPSAVGWLVRLFAFPSPLPLFVFHWSPEQATASKTWRVPFARKQQVYRSQSIPSTLVGDWNYPLINSSDKTAVTAQITQGWVKTTQQSSFQIGDLLKLWGYKHLF